MDPDKIDRLHKANAAFSDRLETPKTDSSDKDSNLLDSQTVNNYGPDKPLDGHIVLSDRFEQVKIKRSQGRNQVANSLKLYNRKTKVYTSIALIANVVIDDKAPEFSEVVKQANNAQLDVIQALFDEFLLSIHEKL